MQRYHEVKREEGRRKIIRHITPTATGRGKERDGERERQKEKYK